eukprot:m.1225579 g.1225579  ORF g.1225579 m.1225579 type:complete len:287 (+) comp24633_c0_seq3:3878-4738(+)
MCVIFHVLCPICNALCVCVVCCVHACGVWGVHGDGSLGSLTVGTPMCRVHRQLKLAHGDENINVSGAEVWDMAELHRVSVEDWTDFINTVFDNKGRPPRLELDFGDNVFKVTKKIHKCEDEQALSMIALEIQELSERGLPDRAFCYLRHVFKQRYAFLQDGDMASIQQKVTNMLRGSSSVDTSATSDVAAGAETVAERTPAAALCHPRTQALQSDATESPVLARRVINNSPYRSAFAAPRVVELKEKFPLGKSGTTTEAIGLVEISPALETPSPRTSDDTAESNIR